MQSHTLKLTVEDFLLGPQEILLVDRYGGQEGRDAPAASGATLRKIIKKALLSRAIQAHVTVGFDIPVIELTTEGFYEHEGRVCKIILWPPQRAEERKNERSERELQAIRVAGWITEHYFATPPLGLRLYYHVVAKGVQDREIKESCYREFPLASEDEIRPIIAERVRRITEAFTKPDDALPECTVDERHGTPGSEYSKCKDWCPARKNCQQIRRYYQKETERSLANERALARIVAEEGPSFAESEAKRRKELIGGMMMAGNFFEENFPREQFRALLKAEAEAEEDFQYKQELLQMATAWNNARFVRWRACLDNQG
jgi:hypothetical protein